MLADLYDELVHMDGRVEKYNGMIEEIAETDEQARLLMTIPGVGPMTATALLAAMGDPGVFRNGREYAASLGLVPRQHSTGGKDRLLGISKRGDRYLRCLLIHGARVVTTRTARREKADRRSRCTMPSGSTRCWCPGSTTRVGGGAARCGTSCRSRAGARSGRATRKKNMSKRIALVTGGIGGIGTAVCRELADRDCTVIAGYYPLEEAGAEAWQARHREGGYDFVIIPVDVTDYRSAGTAASCRRLRPRRRGRGEGVVPRGVPQAAREDSTPPAVGGSRPGGRRLGAG